MCTFSTSSDLKSQQTYCKEAVLWRQLSNPHVLPFLGVHHCPEKPLYVGLVSPWMDNGNVLQYLEKNPQADRKPLLLDVARGIHYLHSFEPPIVHGDLKGANVLITSSFRACVADFGLCTLVQDALVRFTPTKSAYSIGSMVYMAPELVLQENDQEGKPLPKSLASDMYSLGCTFYEMFVGRPQFCGMSYPQLLMAHIEHHRPPRPLITELDDLTWDLINWCCHEDPPARPRAYDVVQSLDSWRFPVEPDVPVCDWDEEIRARLRTALAINPYTGGSEGCSTSSSPWSPISAASSSSTDISIMTSTGGYEMRPLTDQDIVIAIMGPTGTGKSSFINAAIRQACAIVGHDLESCTQKVVAFTCPHPDGSNRNIVFVDTPGFDDSKRTDYDILRDISKWLEQTYRQGITLTGILLFHRISESRMRGTPVKNLAVFEELCGKDALQNVVLTTTMWDEVSIEVGLEHEEQLKTQFWHPMISHGCRTARFESSSDSAWEIINQFDINNRRAVKLQTEVVDEGKKFSETSAYSVMVRWWKQFVEKVRELLDKPLWSPGEKAALRRELNVALRQQKAFDGGRRARPFEGLVTKVAMAYRTRRQTVARRGSSRSEDT
ncbi:kinase-like protein [Leucogyrophana mollusca]|uniref:Kinase-like protein n=1 Tax=Leucogyrophana mollusca TaxID=85980 RepID=A0ACB8BJF7_9AGAM|nr:kinase-like protein [Leucogyrophana mollusca]